jgi:glycerophosphoryl diester phosphodiesterase
VLARYPNTIAAISSFDWDALATLRALAPDQELWVLTDSITEEAISTAQQLSATTLAVDHISLSESSMKCATAAGLQVMAWTVNSQQEANRLRDLGVVAICTDDPGTVR